MSIELGGARIRYARTPGMAFQEFLCQRLQSASDLSETPALLHDPSMPEPLIGHVSDTARWIAAYRALETRRRDALFHDPLADRLAGEQGQAIVAKAPWYMRGGGALIARTKLIDDMVLRAVAEGADTVLNLAAGLDTRPYRLKLPAALKWIEADLPGIVDEKERLLAGEEPVCALAKERIDLASKPALESFLDRATAGSRATLVISEGLLMYLDPETVDELTVELLKRPAVRSWIVNINSPAGVNTIRNGFGKTLGSVALKFAPADGVAYFERRGWRTAEVHSLIRAAIRFRRGPIWLRLLTSFIRESDPRSPKGRWGAVVRFERP